MTARKPPAARPDLVGETPEQKQAREEREASFNDYLEWKRKKEAAAAAKGRKALQDAEEWRPPGEPADGDGKRKRRRKKDESEAAEEPEGDPEKIKKYRPRRIPRFNDKGDLVWTGNTVPDDCPVVPLGYDNLTYWFLTAGRQLVALGEGKLGLTHIKQLFGRHIPYAERVWPKFNRQGVHVGFAAETVADALIMAAGAKGPFDPRDKVRGRGCWRGPNGELVQHLGDRVLVGGREFKPGEISLSCGLGDEEETFVYPARPKMKAPKAGGRADCDEIYARLNSWQWMRGEVDARLLLGWMACVVLGSALDWRPMVFWTGDAGTGKSTLQKYIREILHGRLLGTTDATPASLRQMVGMDSLGVSFDELEADQKNEQARQVVKLARCAASGDTVYRGGQDHKAAEFKLQGAFGFSAIVPPAMTKADTQRFAFLRLKKHGSEKLPKWSAADLRELGAGLVGRATEAWERWFEVLELYRDGLAAVGHEARGQDQFGTLLAAADILLSDGTPDPETVSAWCDQLRRDRIFEYEQSESTWLSTFRHILQAQPEAWRQSGFPTVAERLTRYWYEHHRDHPDRKKKLASIQTQLVRAGLAIVHGKDGRLWLAIPPAGQAIGELFDDHDFKGGAWTNALRGAPEWDGAEGVYKVDNCRALQHVKCTLYRLDAVEEGHPIFDPGPAPSEGPEAIDDEMDEAA